MIPSDLAAAMDEMLPSTTRLVTRESDVLIPATVQVFMDATDNDFDDSVREFHPDHAPQVWLEFLEAYQRRINLTIELWRKRWGGTPNLVWPERLSKW